MRGLRRCSVAKGFVFTDTRGPLKRTNKNDGGRKRAYAFWKISAQQGRKAIPF